LPELARVELSQLRTLYSGARFRLPFSEIETIDQGYGKAVPSIPLTKLLTYL